MQYRCFCGGQLDTGYRCLNCGRDNQPRATPIWVHTVKSPVVCVCGAQREESWHKHCPYCGKAYEVGT
jgi:hypothetical protein